MAAPRHPVATQKRNLSPRWSSKTPPDKSGFASGYPGGANIWAPIMVNPATATMIDPSAV